MTEAKKITAATRSKPATIFLLTVALRCCRRGSNLEARIRPTKSVPVRISTRSTLARPIRKPPCGPGMDQLANETNRVLPMKSKILSGIFICSHAPKPAVIARGQRITMLTTPAAALSIHFPAPISTTSVSPD